jgi:hypothetical protein
MPRLCLLWVHKVGCSECEVCIDCGQGRSKHWLFFLFGGLQRVWCLALISVSVGQSIRCGSFEWGAVCVMICIGLGPCTSSIYCAFTACMSSWWIIGGKASFTCTSGTGGLCNREISNLVDCLWWLRCWVYCHAVRVSRSRWRAIIAAVLILFIQ